MTIRIDIITGCESGKGVHNTWNEVIKAVITGETLIRTTMVNKTINKYDKEGNCISVGAYSNKLCKVLQSLGVHDIRYGSPSYWLQTTKDTYTIYSTTRELQLARIARAKMSA